MILHLTDTGGLTEIPVPVGGRPRPANPPAKRAAGRRPGREGSRARPPARADAGSARPRRSHRPVPLCGSAVVEQEKSYGCSGWQGGLQVRDLEDDRRQADRRAHGPGTPASGPQPGPQGLRVEVGQAVRRPSEAGRGRGPLRFRPLKSRAHEPRGSLRRRSRPRFGERGAVGPYPWCRRGRARAPVPAGAGERPGMAGGERKAVRPRQPCPHIRKGHQARPGHGEGRS